jgi:hypothetical protein
MKYLKLDTEEKLPDIKRTTFEIKKLFRYIVKYESYITFLYFDTDRVNRLILGHMLTPIRPFVLKKIRSDIKITYNFFGQPNEVPIVVYEIIDEENKSNVNKCRLDVINFLGSKCNSEFNPHVSHVSFEECPDLIHVKGIKGNDNNFTINLETKMFRMIRDLRV